MDNDKYHKLTAQGPTTYLQTLHRIGWFDLDQNLEYDVKERISNIETNSQLVVCVCHLFVEESNYINRDAVETLLDDVLRLNGLAKKLHTNVTEPESGIFMIEVKSKHGTRVHEMNEAYDKRRPAFIEEFINRILDEENLTNRFFRVGNLGGGLLYTLVPGALYQIALQEGIIPVDPNFHIPTESA